jgi:hypothetical protein
MRQPFFDVYWNMLKKVIKLVLAFMGWEKIDE